MDTQKMDNVGHTSTYTTNTISVRQRQFADFYRILRRCGCRLLQPSTTRRPNLAQIPHQKL